MAVYQKRRSGGKARGHGLGIGGIEFDQDKALPSRVVALGVGPELVEKRLLELEEFLDVHAGDQGLGGSDGGIDHGYVFEVVGAGGQDGGAFINLGGIEEVEHGEVLDLKNLVHAFEAESALAVEEVGDVSLFEPGLLSQPEPGKFTCIDTVPEDIAKILLQGLELHDGRSIAPGLGHGR